MTMPRLVAIFLLIVLPATVTIAEIILMILAPSPFVLVMLLTTLALDVYLWEPFRLTPEQRAKRYGRK